MLAVVRALHPDVGYEAQRSQACRWSADGHRRHRRSGCRTAFLRTWPRSPAAPPSSISFAARCGLAAGAGAATVSVIAGMAGAGKTQLAVRAGHLAASETRSTACSSSTYVGFGP